MTIRFYALKQTSRREHIQRCYSNNDVNYVETVHHEIHMKRVFSFALVLPASLSLSIIVYWSGAEMKEKSHGKCICAE